MADIHHLVVEVIPPTFAHGALIQILTLTKTISVK